MTSSKTCLLYTSGYTVDKDLLNRYKKHMADEQKRLFPDVYKRQAVTNNCSESMLEVQRRKNSEQAWNQFVQFYIMLGLSLIHIWQAADRNFPPTTVSTLPRKVMRW